MEGQLIHRSSDLHAGAMAGWMTRMAQFLNLWVIRIVVLSSFAAHLVLILFAGIRRHKAFGGRTILLWLAYQGGGWAATSALGNLSLGRTLREQQVVTFWAPFLLLHLGGPDNISAYSLDDNVLSARQMLNVAAQLTGAGYVLYTQIIIGSNGALFWASVIMYFLGAVKNVEKALALWRGDLSSIRSSMKKPRRSGFTERVGLRRGRKLGNEQALLVAHGLFHISKGAFADYSVDDLVKEGDIYINRYSYGWKGMCKVVEMELSLMYDILYTKAAVVHTWFGYGIRVASPLATAAAFLLFWLYNKNGQRRGDVIITYILLVASFLLDLRWLLTALGSTWTYAFLIDRPRCWLHHQLLCTARWHWFRRFIVSLDPCRLLAKEPPSYRLWSGSIGQYNLLHECTHDTTSQWRELAKKVGLQDRWMEYQYHYSRGRDILPHVRELLFERIWNLLKSAYPPEEDDKKDEKKKEEEEKPRKGGIVRKHRELEKALNFDKDFQEDILIWHITTDVFLLCSDQNAASCTYVKAIKALSDYMVFLVVVRPNMVPGLKLRSTYEAIREALDNLWRKKRSSSSSKISPSCTAREKELAKILRNMENKLGTKEKKPRKHPSLYDPSIIPSEETRKSASFCDWSSSLSEGTSKRRQPSLIYDESIILSEGTMHAEELLKILSEGTKLADSGVLKLSEDLKHFICDEDSKQLRPGKIDMQKLLEVIFKAWVRLLIYASIRCSRDSHAKQLSRGGELTTIVWILVEHAGILRIRSDTSSEM